MLCTVSTGQSECSSVLVMAATAGVLVVYRENLMVRMSAHWSAPRSRVSGHIWFSALCYCNYRTSHVAAQHMICCVVGGRGGSIERCVQCQYRSRLQCCVGLGCYSRCACGVVGRQTLLLHRKHTSCSSQGQHHTAVCSCADCSLLLY
jgi:hypothetical protein